MQLIRGAAPVTSAWRHLAKTPAPSDLGLGRRERVCSAVQDAHLLHARGQHGRGRLSGDGLLVRVRVRVRARVRVRLGLGLR